MNKVIDNKKELLQIKSRLNDLILDINTLFIHNEFAVGKEVVVAEDVIDDLIEAFCRIEQYRLEELGKQEATRNEFYN